MLLLQVEGCAKDPQLVRVAKFPFSIGRGPECGLRLEAPGIWGEHLKLQINSKDFTITAAALGEAVLLVNGEKKGSAPLRNGDILQLGSCKILVTLAAAPRVSVEVREVWAWSLVVLVTIIQLVLVAFLH